MSWRADLWAAREIAWLALGCDDVERAAALADAAHTLLERAALEGREHVRPELLGPVFVPVAGVVQAVRRRVELARREAARRREARAWN